MASFCSYYNKGLCRSCAWIDEPYAAQLARKEELIRQALSPGQALRPSMTSVQQGFRNRAKLSVTGTTEAPVIGLLGETTLDAGRELLACPIHHPKLNELIAALPDYIRGYNLIPYRIAERKGELKGLIAFYSPQSEQMYLRFVLRSKECVSRIKKLLPALQKQFPTLVCISANIQPIPHAILEGPEELILTEKKIIDHELGALRLKLAPEAFVQTNATVAAALYETAASWIAEAGARRVLELFCGQGAFSFFAAAAAAKAGASPQFLGIDINADAVRTANDTAGALALDHLQFKSADLTKLGVELSGFKPDLILANPPRRGLAEAVSLIQAQNPDHFLYSSCSLESLAIDLKALSPGYRLKRVQLFDMFPHTEHFETLVWLER